MVSRTDSGVAAEQYRAHFLLPDVEDHTLNAVSEYDDFAVADVLHAFNKCDTVADTDYVSDLAGGCLKAELVNVGAKTRQNVLLLAAFPRGIPETFRKLLAELFDTAPFAPVILLRSEAQYESAAEGLIHDNINCNLFRAALPPDEIRKARKLGVGRRKYANQCCRHFSSATSLKNCSYKALS